MKNSKLEPLDMQIYRYFPIKELYTKLFKIITFFGSAPFLILILFILVLFFPNNSVYSLIILILIEWIVTFFLKTLFKRNRPNIRTLIFEKGYSYPSGHTTNATCFYGFLIFLIFQNIFLIPLKLILIILLLIFILLIGLSRIYLGVHYFSDVIAAILISLILITVHIYFLIPVLN